MKATIPAGGLLALDWGGVKVGYATCDETGLVITPRGRIARRSRKTPWELNATDILELRRLIERFEPGAILLGLPLNADGSESRGSEGARALARQIHAALHLEVILVSEILTSWASRAAEDEDAAAAALLISDYLGVT